MYNSNFLRLISDRSGPLGVAYYLYDSSTDPSELFSDIISTGYFNQANIDNPGTFEINDMITIIAADGFGNFNISAIDPDIILNPR